MTTIQFMDEFEESFLQRLAQALPENLSFLHDILATGKAPDDGTFDELLDAELLLTAAPEWLKSAVNAGFKEVGEFSCFECGNKIHLQDLCGRFSDGLNNSVSVESACACKHCGEINYLEFRLKPDFDAGQVLLQRPSEQGWQSSVLLEK